MKKNPFITVLGVETGLLAGLVPAVYLAVSRDQFVLFKRTLSEMIICLICLTLAAGLATGRLRVKFAAGHWLLCVIILLGLLSLIGRPDQYNGLYDVVRIVDWLIVAAAGCILLRAPGAALGLARWVSAGLLITCGFGLFEHFTGTSPFIDPSGWDGRISSTYGAPTLYAGYLLAAYGFARAGIGLARGAPEKIFHFSALAACIVNIIFTGTATALAGLAAAEIFLLGYTYAKKPKLLFASAAIVLVAIAVFGLWINTTRPKALKKFSQEKFASMEMRTDRWNLARDMMADHPVRGVGIGHYGIYYPVYKGRVAGPDDIVSANARPENLFMLFAAELGVPGLLALLALLGTIVFSKPSVGEDVDSRSYVSACLRGGAAGVIVYACFHFPLHTAGVWPLFFLAAGGAWALAARDIAPEPAGRKIPAAFVFAAFGIFIAVFSFTFMVKEARLTLAQKYIDSRDYDAAVEQAAAAVRLTLGRDWKSLRIHYIFLVKSGRRDEAARYADFLKELDKKLEKPGR